MNGLQKTIVLIIIGVLLIYVYLSTRTVITLENIRPSVHVKLFGQNKELLPNKQNQKDHQLDFYYPVSKKMISQIPLDIHIQLLLNTNIGYEQRDAGSHSWKITNLITLERHRLKSSSKPLITFTKYGSHVALDWHHNSLNQNEHVVLYKLKYVNNNGEMMDEKIVRLHFIKEPEKK